MVHNTLPNGKSATANRTRLCKVDDVVEGNPVAVNVPGVQPLAAYRVGDEYFVTDNVCTHAYSLLTDGFQDGEMIECEVHGGTFDIRTGSATGFPCRTPLKTFDVVVADGWISVISPDSDDQ
ncbi:non-heme iron oxygenase ferredoxin subunit [Rhodococcus opacus]|uniref:non-heme iron oxygenase ferredoxin subunit n=1 Tax=Rhodococcus opacus TaxID=37919 RepID=UPI000FFB987F|nr:non-heme iron oxygenase ferredoxin subunit [Rhodococcus opacus]